MLAPGDPTSTDKSLFCHNIHKTNMARKILQNPLDFAVKRNSIEISPPIQFRIEWADSQGMSPLLGCRPILIFLTQSFTSDSRLTRASFLVSFVRTGQLCAIEWGAEQCYYACPSVSERFHASPRTCSQENPHAHPCLWIGPRIVDDHPGLCCHTTDVFDAD